MFYNSNRSDRELTRPLGRGEDGVAVGLAEIEL